MVTVVWVSWLTLHWSALRNAPIIDSSSWPVTDISSNWYLQLLPNNKQKEVGMFSAPLARCQRKTSIWVLFTHVSSPASFQIEPWTSENWNVFISLELYVTSQDLGFSFLSVTCNYYNKLKVPKLGALCKVMSRITRVPKQDHIRRNCWATFFKEPCLLAATCKKTDISNTEKLISTTWYW